MEIEKQKKGMSLFLNSHVSIIPTLILCILYWNFFVCMYSLYIMSEKKFFNKKKKKKKKHRGGGGGEYFYTLHLVSTQLLEIHINDYTHVVNLIQRCVTNRMV